MTTHKFRPNVYLARGSAKMRSTVFLLAVATMGYAAGALLHGSPPLTNEALALAGPTQAAEIRLSTALSPAVPLPAVRGAKESRLDAGGIEDPRECDLPKGISTACLFMD